MFLWLLAFWSVVASAGDLGRLNFLGFSSNGVYAAFEVYGYHDGSGHPFSRISLLNISDNKMLPPPFEKTGETDDVEDSASLARVRKGAAALAHKKLSQLGVAKPSPVSQLLVHHPLTDTGVDPLHASFRANEAAYTLTLVVLPAPPTKTCKLEDAAKMFSLELKNTGTGKSVVLQKDATLPASRGCVQSYRIQDVYWNPPTNNWVVFLNVSRPGFEGGDEDFLAVTGGPL